MEQRLVELLPTSRMSSAKRETSERAGAKSMTLRSAHRARRPLREFDLAPFDLHMPQNAQPLLRECGNHPLWFYLRRILWCIPETLEISFRTNKISSLSPPNTATGSLFLVGSHQGVRFPLKRIHGFIPNNRTRKKNPELSARCPSHGFIPGKSSIPVAKAVARWPAPTPASAARLGGCNERVRVFDVFDGAHVGGCLQRLGAPS